jgi:hypothetical protein
VAMSTDGEVANALVCKTSIHGFKSHSVLHKIDRGDWRMSAMIEDLIHFQARSCQIR